MIRRDWLILLLVVLVGLLLSMTGWWRGSSSGTQIRVPMFYDAHYLFHRAWVQEQSVPDRPNPASILLTSNNQVSQSWRNATDELSAVRVWVRAGEGQTLAWSIDVQGQLYRGRHIFETASAGYLTLRLPDTLRDVRGETVRLRLFTQQSDTVILRTVNGNRLWGELRLNEFIQPANLDMHALATGRYLGFVEAIGEQLLPAVFRVRLQQYKPDFLKGNVFISSLVVVLVGSAGLLLWSLPMQRGRVWVVSAAVVAFFSWQIGSGRLLFAPLLTQSRPIASSPLSPIDFSAERLHTDFATTLYTAVRLPDPRFVALGDHPAPHISVPSNSSLQYSLIIPFNARLRVETSSAAQAIYIGETRLEGGTWYDLTQWGGQAQTLRFEAAEAADWYFPQLYVSTDFVTAESDPQAARFRFGEHIELLAVSPSEHGVELSWRVAQQTTRYPTVFVHVLDAQGEIIAQHDGAPVSGTYPVALWQPHAIIRDFHPLTLPSEGAYTIAVGLYDPVTLDRYPVTDSNGVNDPTMRAIVQP